MTYELHRIDAEDWLAELPDESVDLAIFDPPYESLEKHRKIGTTTRLKQSKSSSNEWFDIYPNARFPALFEQLYRVLAKDRHLYMQCDAETMFVAKPLLETAGFKVWKPLIWDKMRIGMGYHYRARYEVILFCAKGNRKLADLGVADVLTVPRVHGRYPTEKPLELIQTLVRQSAKPGELVIDPFVGSGTVGEAALLHGCRFAGVDTSERALALAHERLAKAMTP